MECFTQNSRRFLSINLKWLPIKLHYFLMFGAVAGVTPFLTVIGKSLGLSTTAVGITYTLLPISIFIFKPLFGLLADHIQNTKLLVMCLVTAKVVLSLFILFLNPIKEDNYNQSCIEVQMDCKNYDQPVEKLLFHFRESCFKKSHIINNLTTCNISFDNLTSYVGDYSSNLIQVKKPVSVYNISKTKQPSKNNYCTESITDLNCKFLLNNNNFTGVKNNCKRNHSDCLSMTCDHELESCLVPKQTAKFYSTHQFWIYMLLVVTSCCSISIATSLTDVSCYEILDEQKEYFGRQRLFGTASTGIITFCSGYFNDLMSNEDGRPDYLAGFYVMVALYLLDIIILFKTNLPKSNMSTSVITDIKNLCRMKEFIAFSIAVCAIGILTSLNANYLLWYLTDLGANQTLLGLTIAVQCLVAEIPFFFFSGWFIKRLGYFNCLTCSFAAFALRFGMYYLLKNPWMVLPIETLHGLTYAVFYSTNTAFASAYAPPGTEATVFGFLCGLYNGLGIAVGSLLSGLSFNEFGGSKTFLIGSCFSSLCILLTITSHFVFKTPDYKEVVASEKEAVTAMKSDDNDCL